MLSLCPKSSCTEGSWGALGPTVGKNDAVMIRYISCGSDFQTNPTTSPTVSECWPQEFYNWVMKTDTNLVVGPTPEENDLVNPTVFSLQDGVIQCMAVVNIQDPDVQNMKFIPVPVEGSEINGVRYGQPVYIMGSADGVTPLKNYILTVVSDGQGGGVVSVRSPVDSYQTALFSLYPTNKPSYCSDLTCHVLPNMYPSTLLTFEYSSDSTVLYPETCPATCKICKTDSQCASGTVCFKGSCVPACDVMKCAQNETCVNGVCMCGNTKCASGESCGLQGVCTCNGKVCSSDEGCLNGVCTKLCGDALCTDGQKCVSNKCVDLCGTNVCDSNQVCVNGVCMTTCGKNMCAPGYGCSNNNCVPLCGGKICGLDQKCVNQVCLTICGKDADGNNITCNENETCVNGKCVTLCGDVVCTDNQKCVDKKCVSLCQGVTCPNGQTCIQGKCIVPCQGVTCSDGQSCNPSTNECVPNCQLTPCNSGYTCNTDSGQCDKKKSGMSNTLKYSLIGGGVVVVIIIIIIASVTSSGKHISYPPQQYRYNYQQKRN